MTSPISDILKPWRLFVHSEYDGTNQLDEQLAAVTEAEQALTALLEAELNKAAQFYDYTDDAEIAHDIIDSIKMALGIPTEPKA